MCLFRITISLEAVCKGRTTLCRRAMPVIQPLPRRRRSALRRGLDPALVQSFPTYAHDADKLAKGISQTPKSEQPR